MTEEQMGAPAPDQPPQLSLVQQVGAKFTAAIQAGTWEQAADLVSEAANQADPAALDTLAWLDANMRRRASLLVAAAQS